MRIVSILVLATLVGCIADPTKDPQPEAVVVTDLLVPGACPVTDDLSVIEVSAVVVGEEDAIGPQSTPPSFEFTRLAEDPAGSLPGRLTGLDVFDVGLTVESAEFRPSGGADRRDDSRLVLLMVDSSGSLRGRDVVTEEVDDGKASDKDDQRFAFLKRFIGDLPREHFISLISFNNEIPSIDPGDSNDGPAVPTRNRDIIEQGLDDLEQAEEGATPLARALVDGKASIIDSNTDLNPMVILLTDGIEGGDPTDDAQRSRLRAAINSYEAAQIPVIVLQLQPPEAAGTPRGRDPLLVELACRTGGEHFFVEEPEEFTAAESLLSSMLMYRLAGAWILRTRVDMGGASLRSGSYFLSTVLGVNFGDGWSTEHLAAPRDPLLGFLDTRLWLTKP